MPTSLADPVFLKKFLETINTISPDRSDSLASGAVVSGSSPRKQYGDFGLEAWMSTLGNLSEDQKAVLTEVMRVIDDTLPKAPDKNCDYYNGIFGDSLISTIQKGEFGFKNKGDPINPLFPDLLAAEIAKSEASGGCTATQMREIVVSSGYGIAFAACFLGIAAMAGFGTLGGSFGWILLLGGLAFAAYTAHSDQRVTPYKDQFFAYLDRHVWSTNPSNS